MGIRGSSWIDHEGGSRGGGGGKKLTNVEIWCIHAIPFACQRSLWMSPTLQAQNVMAFLFTTYKLHRRLREFLHLVQNGFLTAKKIFFCKNF